MYGTIKFRKLIICFKESRNSKWRKWSECRRKNGLLQKRSLICPLRAWQQRSAKSFAVLQSCCVSSIPTSSVNLLRRQSGHWKHNFQHLRSPVMTKTRPRPTLLWCSHCINYLEWVVCGYTIFERFWFRKVVARLRGHCNPSKAIEQHLRVGPIIM